MKQCTMNKDKKSIMVILFKRKEIIFTGQ